MQNLGKNVEFKVEGKKLTLVIDLEAEQGLSGSGKSTIVATTSGNVKLPGDSGVTLGINAYRPTKN